MNDDRGYTDADLAAVSDNPEWTEADFAEAKPFHELFPDLVAALKEQNTVDTGGGTLRVLVGIDRDLAESFWAHGPGWEVRLNEALRSVVKGAA